MSDDEDIMCTPQDILNTAQEVTENLLPTKSKKLYNKYYENFMEWRSKKNATSFSENVLLAYFQEKSNKLAPSSLWSEFSIIKSTLCIYHQIDISKYHKLHAFLKRKSEGYKTKKSKTFSPGEINSFINGAPDDIHLLNKVAVIFGVMGACRRQELHTLLYQHVQQLDGALLIHIMNTKTRIDRTFTITGKLLEITKKYIDLRPKPCKNPNFFIRYHNGKCTSQNVGINTFGNIGKTVAKYMKLPNPELFTGHCFRRTSATLLIDAGGDITDLKSHGGWRSTGVAESYIDNSIKSKLKVSTIISKSIEQSSNSTDQNQPELGHPSTSRQPSYALESTEQPEINENTQPDLLNSSPTFTPNPHNDIHVNNPLDLLTSSATFTPNAQSEINLSQILKQHNAPLVITNNSIQNLHIHLLK